MLNCTFCRPVLRLLAHKLWGAPESAQQAAQEDAGHCGRRLGLAISWQGNNGDASHSHHPAPGSSHELFLISQPELSIGSAFREAVPVLDDCLQAPISDLSSGDYGKATSRGGPVFQPARSSPGSTIYACCNSQIEAEFRSYASQLLIGIALGCGGANIVG